MVLVYSILIDFGKQTFVVQKICQVIRKIQLLKSKSIKNHVIHLYFFKLNSFGETVNKPKRFFFFLSNLLIKIADQKVFLFAFLSEYFSITIRSVLTKKGNVFKKCNRTSWPSCDAFGIMDTRKNIFHSNCQIGQTRSIVKLCMHSQM